MDEYIKRLTEAAEEGIKNAIVKTALLLEGENKKQAPIDTSRLKNSIYTSVDKPKYLAEVRAKTNYANYVIHGTGIYNTQGVHRRDGWYYNVSDPRSKYYGWHYTEGQEPNDFPHEAYNKKKKDISKIIDSEIDKAISKL